MNRTILNEVINAGRATNLNRVFLADKVGELVK